MIDSHVVIYMRENKDKFKNAIFIDHNLTSRRVEEFIDKINQCERVVSTCLHGVIACHAYNIPVRWISEGSKIIGDGVKFRDHFNSLNLEAEPIPMIKDDNIKFDNTNHMSKLNELSDNLWKCRPWLQKLDDDYYVDLDDENWQKECYPDIYTGKIFTDKDV